MTPDFSKGLVPAVAQDADTGRVLMLAYMDQEAWDKTRETGRAWFLSRERGLWEKGATSGNTMEVVEVFPLLDVEGEFVAEPSADGLDVVFSCLPHGMGAGKARGWLDAGIRVIDMSADFRLRDAADYPRWYRQPHPEPGLLKQAVLG